MNETETNFIRWYGEVTNQEQIRPHLMDQEYNTGVLGC